MKSLDAVGHVEARRAAPRRGQDQLRPVQTGGEGALRALHADEPATRCPPRRPSARDQSDPVDRAVATSPPPRSTGSQRPGHMHGRPGRRTQRRGHFDLSSAMLPPHLLRRGPGPAHRLGRALVRDRHHRPPVGSRPSGPPCGGPCPAGRARSAPTPDACAERGCAVRRSRPGLARHGLGDHRPPRSAIRRRPPAVPLAGRCVVDACLMRALPEPTARRQPPRGLNGERPLPAGAGTSVFRAGVSSPRRRGDLSWPP